ncbi:MAG: ABC transporter ATP-binding protein [Azospirillaceae bacterium]|nr:ABC transporter ATP-binding protein [Azospirillaceae bacterium]
MMRPLFSRRENLSPIASVSDLVPVAVTVRDARLTYGGIPVFQDLDLRLAAGRWTCLLGPSGVGKTTLLRLIAGLSPAEPPTLIRADDGLPLDGRMAYMAQQDLLLPWLSVLDNAVLGDQLRHGTVNAARRERARTLLTAVGLGDRLGDRPDALSGGMRQRVALVRTLIEDRPLVLMDEPFSALDAVTRLRLQGLARHLLNGRTVLLVTHDPLEALRLGDAVHVLAGEPARLSPPIVPPGAPPRDPSNPVLLALQADLLQRLAE